MLFYCLRVDKGAKWSLRFPSFGNMEDTSAIKIFSSEIAEMLTMPCDFTQGVFFVVILP